MGVFPDVVLSGVFLSDAVEFVLSSDLSPELACAPWLVSSACWGLPRVSPSLLCFGAIAKIMRR